MDIPKVSICIPAYNNAAEVKRLLESIRMQTFRDLEIILTDDSTNEEIAELIKSSGWDDIRYIQAVIGLDGLPDNLREMALVRLERPDATLKELGEALNPPVGKSGVNHRLRKLGILADDLRERSVKQ